MTFTMLPGDSTPGPETEPMPNPLSSHLNFARRLWMGAAVAALAMSAGCVGYHPGGNLQSEDTFTYWSTPHMPQTVTLIDTRTNERIWTYEIPVGKQVVMRFYKDTSPGAYFSDTMRWEVMDVETTGGSLDNILPVPNQYSRRVDVEMRPGPEQAPASTAGASK